MSNYRLDKVFSPRSVALVGASPRAGALGHAVLANLRRANPSNPPWLVNPAHTEIDGLECRKSLLELATPPDLVVIAVPPEGVVEVAGLRIRVNGDRRRLGLRGIRGPNRLVFSAASVIVCRVRRARD